MAIRAVSILKNVTFRGKATTFSNTYHYFAPNEPGSGYEGMIDALVTFEKQIHSNDVNFKSARLWSAGGTDLQNETLFMKDLTGNGAGGVATSMDRERAILVQWDCGRNILMRKVYLRKWYHACGNPVGAAGLGAAGVLQQTAEISSTDLTAINTKADSFSTFIVGSTTWTLCSPKGVVAQSSAKAYKWLEHHQLGDNWRN